MSNLALKVCQDRYDHMLPDDTDCFLDTNEGANWIDGAADRLMGGDDYQVNSWTGVTCGDLHTLVGNQTQHFMASEDPNLIGWMLCAIQDGDIAGAKEALTEILYDMHKGNLETIVRNAAYELLTDISEAAAEQIRLDNEADDYDH